VAVVAAVVEAEILTAAAVAGELDCLAKVVTVQVAQLFAALLATQEVEVQAVQQGQDQMAVLMVAVALVLAQLLAPVPVQLARYDLSGQVILGPFHQLVLGICNEPLH
jgi:hypothetical protein